jgi:hypothetical protein
MSSHTENNQAVRVPEAAIRWIRNVFLSTNNQVAATLSRIPTHHEPELDMQLIAALNQVPAVAGIEGWTVYIQTHFLGGRRHFYNWEVADIGLLIIFRDRGRVLRIKVGLLQSKRLYPREVNQLPDYKNRTRIGFATLLEDPEAFRQLAAGRTFTFEPNSEYLAIDNKGEQQRRLTAYQKMSKIPVYYLLYNPVDIPWSATVPTVTLMPLPKNRIGCRVVPVNTLISALDEQSEGYHPKFSDMFKLGEPFRKEHISGWSLEYFVTDLMICGQQGHIASDETDHVLEQLFYNRSGPISAAIAVTIEAPEGSDFLLPDVGV